MVPFLDLSVTFHIVVDGAPKGEQAAVRITNEMMKNWGVHTDDLMELAKKNTKKLLPPHILTMKELLGQGMPDEIEEEMAYGKLYILTNQYKIHGASVVLYQGVIRNFAEKIEKDLYLLPSSIHEFILLPKENGMKKEALEEMVRSVNNTQLPKEEFLSNYVYYYERKRDELTKL
jgi:antitoxin component of MazEF toxin-antitoxin module